MKTNFCHRLNLIQPLLFLIALSLLVVTSKVHAQNLCADLISNKGDAHQAKAFSSDSTGPKLNDPSRIAQLIRQHKSAFRLRYYLVPEHHLRGAESLASKYYIQKINQLDSKQKDFNLLVQEILNRIVLMDNSIQSLNRTYFKSYEAKGQMIEILFENLDRSAAKTLLHYLDQIEVNSNVSKNRFDQFTKTKAFEEAVDSFAVELIDVMTSNDLFLVDRFFTSLFLEVKSKFLALKLKEQERDQQLKQDEKKRLQNEKEKKKQKEKRLVEIKLAFERFDKHLDKTNFHEFDFQFFEMFFRSYYFKGIELVALKLSNYRWFQNLPSLEKKYFLFTVIKLYFLSENVSHKLHAKALKNTADFITNGYYKFIAESGKFGEAGYASHEHISITKHLLTDQSLVLGDIDLAVAIESLKHNESVRILAHEASHIISGTPRSTSFEYFVEEYRARQVEYFVTHGQVPNAQVSLRYSLELILGKSNLYPDIQKSVLLQPEYYEKFMASFFKGNGAPKEIAQKLMDAQSLSHADRMNLIENLLSEMSVEATTPYIGWKDYLLNANKTRDQKLMQSEIVDPQLVQLIDRLKRKIFANEAEAARW